MNDEKKSMTVREMLPNLELMFKAGVERVVVYANIDSQHVPDLGNDDAPHCESSCSFEPKTIDDALQNNIAEILCEYLDCKIVALIKSQVNPKVIALLVYGDVTTASNPEIAPDEASLVGQKWRFLPEYDAKHFVYEWNNNGKPYVISFYVNNEDEPRATIAFPGSNASEEELTAAVQNTQKAIPEFEDSDQKTTDMLAKCVEEQAYNVRLGFNHPEGEYFQSEEENPCDFRKNFIIPGSDETQFVPPSSLFVSTEDWQSLID